MKRINGLFDKICTEENILLAYRNATRGKKHYKDVIAFNKDLKNNLKTLLIELKTLTYRTSPYYDISATYEDREIKFTTFAEMIIEAAEQISNSDLPFETKIISENGFYKFE